jgi:hypothetical protein
MLPLSVGAGFLPVQYSDPVTALPATQTTLRTRCAKVTHHNAIANDRSLYSLRSSSGQGLDGD